MAYIHYKHNETFVAMGMEVQVDRRSGAIKVLRPEIAARGKPDLPIQDAWSKDRLRREILELSTLPGAELVRGAGGCAEGLPESFAGATIPKFRPDGLLIVHAGGRAGLFSAIIGGWINGEGGSQPVTREIRT